MASRALALACALVAGASGVYSATLPGRMMGMYVLLADNTVENYTSTDTWTPGLYDYQTAGANTLFFTFIDPTDMAVPPAFATLAQSRGSGAPGAVEADTTVIFSVGGYSYSMSPNPWPFLATPEAAKAMAQEVATWPEKYGCDGIDMDIESGAGDASGVGSNVVVFMQALREANPDMIITQPVFGYPQVAAENAATNAACDADGSFNGLIDSVGIMVYEGTQALDYVKNYAEATDQWDGFPITCDIPSTGVIVGMGGNAAESDILSMADSVKAGDLGGIMVWYASVIDADKQDVAFQYGPTDDATESKDTTGGDWAEALTRME